MDKKMKIRPFLIFTSKYISDSSLNRDGVSNTKEVVEKAFFSLEGLNIPIDDGIIIENEKYVPICEKIRNFIYSLNRENDIYLFYFCGHGYPDYNEETVYLAMTDTTPQNFNTCGYNVKQIVALLKSVQVKHYIIILDCCHSGFLCEMGEAFRDVPIDINKHMNNPGAVYISSTTADDVCSQTCIDGKYYIPFSYYLAKTFLGCYTEKTEVLSLSDIVNLVNVRLDEMKYNTRSIIQSKSEFAKVPLFLVGKSNKENKSNIFYFSKAIPNDLI